MKKFLLIIIFLIGTLTMSAQNFFNYDEQVFGLPKLANSNSIYHIENIFIQDSIYEVKYRELSRKKDITVTTTVEFTFEIEGKEYVRQFEIPHFNPKDEADILKGVCNRYESELRDLETELGIKTEDDK